jgi:hypothetical protein
LTVKGKSNAPVGTKRIILSAHEPHCPEVNNISLLELMRPLLLRLIHGDALLAGLLLGFGFLGDQRLVHPMVGSL